MKTYSLTGIALASLTIWTGCNEKTLLGNDPCDVFKSTLAVQDRFLQPATAFNSGEEIHFNLEIANTTNAPATLMESSPCSAVTFEVFDSAKQRQWGSADNIGCIQVLLPRNYLPYERLQYTGTWQPDPNGSPPVQPGTFTVVATVSQYIGDSQGQLLQCHEALSTSARFRIQ